MKPGDVFCEAGTIEELKTMVGDLDDSVSGKAILKELTLRVNQEMTT